jgi:hypothetical protein
MQTETHVRPSPRPRVPAPVTRREGLAIARRFLDEMREHRLEYVLVRADEPKHSGHMVRCVSDENPEWYQDFCALYTARRRKSKRRRANSRRHDTLIKRRETVRALGRIIEGGRETVYTDRLKDFIRREGRKYLR